MTDRTMRPPKLLIATMLVFVVSLAATSARQQGSQAVPIDGDDVGGVVSGPKGPEAGVWVIAETTQLPTRFAKIVVTDDRGRYLIPDLPKATYSVWVRGYGLVDSPKVDATPGKAVNLTAVVAPDAHAAAQYYPAGYWFSLIEGAGQVGVSGHGTVRQRHLGECAESAGIPSPAEERDVPRVPPAREQGDPGDSRGARDVLLDGAGVGAPAAVRPGRRGHDLRARQSRTRACPHDVRRLDRPHHEG